jgi:exodeoxyribonuclease-3
VVRSTLMKVATYNVNSIRRRLPIVLDWIAQHKPDVMCLQETKVQDNDFPVDAFRDAGYHASFRGMKAYNGVATLTRRPPEKVVHGLHEGADNEDFRISKPSSAVSRSSTRTFRKGTRSLPRNMH